MKENELVSHAFNYLQKENKELISQEMLNKNIAMEYFFIQYLNKTLTEDHLIIEEALENGIKLKYKVCCITFFSNNRDIFKLLASLKKLVEVGNNTNLIPCYRIKGIRHEDFLLILSFEHEEQIKPFLYKIHEMSTDINIGIGTIENVGFLSHSYTH